MALPQDTIDVLARIVDRAAVKAEPITMLTEAHPEMTIEDAYEIQRTSMERRFERGEVLVGMKMGLTSQAKMDQMGVHNPIYGHLTDAMQRTSGDTIVREEHCHPRVEPEIAFVLGADLQGPTTPQKAMESVSGICGAIEVIDSRYKDFKFTLVDVVADNASSTRFVLGDMVLPPAEVDGLGNLGMVFSINGEVKATGSSAAILDHPARSLAALANMLAERGERLEAGQIVLAGGATKAFHVEPGDHVELEVDGLGSTALFVA